MNRFKIIFVLLFISKLAFSQGENLFDDSFLHEIHFNNMDTSLIGTKTYQMLNMVFDGINVDSVGMKDKGNISVGVPNLKLPFKIKTNKYVNGKKYDGIKEFTLHNNYQDPTMMREKLTYDFCAQLGLYSLRTAYAKVFINGKYWGLYTIVEGKDEMFKHQFNHRDADAIESLDFGDMCYISDNPNDYNYNLAGLPYYQLENGNETTAFERFAIMIDKANNTPDVDYLNTVSDYLNLEHFFKYQAANVYLMNFDSYIGFLGNQIYTYDTIVNTWQIIPWDFNASLNLWDNGMGNQSANAYSIFPSHITSGCIAQKLNSIPELKNYYLNTMCEFVNDFADTTKIISRIDFFKNQIQSAVHDDWRKVYSNTEFDQTTEYGNFNIESNEFEGLKTFFIDRHNLITQNLVDEGFICVPTAINNTTNTISFDFFPNPSNGFINIKGDYLIDQVSIYDTQGRKIKEVYSPKFPLNVSDLNSGIYFISVITDDGIITSKLIIQ